MARRQILSHSERESLLALPGHCTIFVQHDERPDREKKHSPGEVL